MAAPPAAWSKIAMLPDGNASSVPTRKPGCANSLPARQPGGAVCPIRLAKQRVAAAATPLPAPAAGGRVVATGTCTPKHCLGSRQ